MRDPVKRALTRRIRDRRGRIVEVEPNKKVLYAVYFGLGIIICLCFLEAVYMLTFNQWSNEIFSAIMAVAGTIASIFINQKARED